MAGRYECTLSSEALKKAVDELNEPEDNDARLAAIDKLRTRFEEEAGDLELIRNDDAFILRFLRVRKFNADKAFATLVNYHKQRKEWREVFDGLTEYRILSNDFKIVEKLGPKYMPNTRGLNEILDSNFIGLLTTKVDDPKLVEPLLRSGTFITLRNGRAKDGSFVMVGRPGLGFTDTTNMSHFITCLVLSIEKILEQEESQIYGFTMIEDMSHFGLAMALQMATQGRKFIHVIQDCLPARVKSVNMVNEALVFDIIHTIVSQFMKEKMKKRLTLHGSNLKTLQDKVDESYLPFFLGGTGADLNPDWWVGQIMSTEGEGEDTAL